MKNLNPTKTEEYKYSTPIEGPDDQYGSAEKPDDDDERETVTETEKTTNRIIQNTTRNRTVITIPVHEQKLNKIRKIINKYEIGDREFASSGCVSSYSIVLVYIPTLVVSIFAFILDLT